METFILNKPSGILLSSAIGNINLYVEDDFVNVQLTGLMGSLVNERYYPHEGEVTLYDLASLIEADMLTWGNIHSSFQLSIYDPSGVLVDACTLDVIFCDRFTVSTDVSSFLRKNFLTTYDFRRVPAGMSHTVTFFAEEGESLEAVIAYSVRGVDGHFHRETLNLNVGMTAEKSGIQQMAISQLDIVKDASEKLGVSILPKRLMSFAIWIGEREMSFWIDNLLDSADCFYFRNCFNAMEAVWLPLQTTYKTEVDRSTAIINGSSRFYNQSVIETYEVKATSLTFSEGQFINQLFTSHAVYRALPNDKETLEDITLREVLITESTCEISDSDEELPTAKFTWRYADNRPFVRLPFVTGIFSEQFTRQFR